jgi:D-3-phosphoglycerate dehydrogenase
MTPRILISCRQMLNVYDEFAERLKSAGVEVDLAEFTGQQLSEQDLLAVIHQYDGMIAGDDELTRPVLLAASKLRVISRWGVGLDSVDLAAAAELGITVTNTPGVFDDEVADVTVAYLILLARQLHVIDAAVRAGSWPKIQGRSLAGSTLGVVGLGGIGRATCRRGHALGMIVIGSDPRPAAVEAAGRQGVEVVTFKELLRRSDAVALNCPLTAETRHMFDSAAFERIRPGLLLVNTARGPVVEEAALVQALLDGRVSGAALDVFETEPLPSDSRLRGLDNVILGAHNASNTREAVLRTSSASVDNLLAHLGSRR